MATDISGAGATFPAPVYARWAELYKQQTGQALNYQAIGSGGGIKQIKAKTVDFGASDKPLKPEELAASGLYQFPTVVGGVVPIINLPGLAAGRIKLNGKILGDIYLGKVNRWNDPEIQGVNPQIKLPGTPITVVHRSDGSGTSFLYTSFLTMTNPEWASKVGASDSVQWPTGLGGKGNDGVSAFVKQTVGSIGYVEYAYAKQNKAAYALVCNKMGKCPLADGGKLRRRGCRCAVEQGAGQLSAAAQPAGREFVADRRRDLHPDVSQPGEPDERRSRAEVLRLGVQERRPGSGEARLCAAAARGEEPRASPVDRDDPVGGKPVYVAH